MLAFSLLAGCSLASEIPDVTLTTCINRVGQIVKIAPQRTTDAGTINVITIGTTNPNVLATWTALQAAADNTKVARMPIVSDPQIEIGDFREAGGGNASVNGIPTILGVGPTKFTFKLYDADQTLIETYKAWKGETLSVFFANADGEVLGLVDDNTTPTTFKGVPIEQWHMSDRQPGGFEEMDYHLITFYAAAKWSDNLYFVTPTDFDPLVSL